MIAQILLQLTSAAASVGRVKTSSHIVSRRFNALALGAVAADFAVKYARTPRADYLVGLILFVVLTARTLLILGFSKIEGNTFRRRVACAVAFLVCAVASIAGQFYLSEPIRPADPAATGRHWPWLPRRGVKQHDCAPTVRPRYGMRDGRVRAGDGGLGLGFQEFGVGRRRNDLQHEQIL